MKIFLVYGTNSSGTQAIGEIIGETLRTAGHMVTLQRASEPEASHLSGYDLIILGSCTWERLEGTKHLEGQLQEHMYTLVQKLRTTEMPGQKFAVFGLGDSSFSNFCAAADHLEHFVADIGGTRIVPSLRIDRYFFDPETARQSAQAWASTLATAMAATVKA